MLGGVPLGEGVGVGGARGGRWLGGMLHDHVGSPHPSHPTGWPCLLTLPLCQLLPGVGASLQEAPGGSQEEAGHEDGADLLPTTQGVHWGHWLTLHGVMMWHLHGHLAWHLSLPPPLSPFAPTNLAPAPRPTKAPKHPLPTYPQILHNM